tara:strand:+ start:2017 stop:6522 length:4506 start_codon:yes stop_codon:yes gene_type:complete
MVIENECVPQNVYGPYEQTLFLGCSVISFSASAGWNGQASELTVELVADNCGVPAGATPKKYWAYKNTIYNLAQNWTDADPGFTYPNIGAPAYFRVANFEFSGLIQAWTEKKGADGLPTFSVKLVDPRPILDHAKVILDAYQGTNLIGAGNHLHNIFNVYAYLEERNSTIPAVNDVSTGVGLGSPIGRVGGSFRTENGISWSLVKKALKDLCGGPLVNPAPNFSTGGIAYVNGQNQNNLALAGGGEIYIPPSDNQTGAGTVKYLLDLDELPDPYTWDYRITGPIASISEIIDQVCNDAGVDYYIELLPTPAALGATGIMELVIKVRTVARINQPALGSLGAGKIKSFIEANSIANGGQGVISNSFGRELRTETNSSLIIGGKARQYYEETDTNYIEPYWGIDADGGLIRSSYNVNTGYQIRLDFAKLNVSLTHPFAIDLINNRYGWVYETQLRFAMGDYNSFLKNIMGGAKTTVLEKYYTSTLNLGAGDIEGQNVRNQQTVIDNPAGTDKDDGKPDDPRTLDAKAVHEWLNSYASEYYGKQFLIQLPSVSYAPAGTTASESSEINTIPVLTDEPSTEGAWPSVIAKTSPFAAAYLTEKDNILNIANPSSVADVFKDDQGKVQPILKFYKPVASGLGLSNFNSEDYVSASGTTPDFSTAWVKADINEQFIIGNPRVDGSAASANYLSALLSISDMVIDVTGSPTLSSNTVPEKEEVDEQPLVPQTQVRPNTEVYVEAPKMLGGQQVTVNAIGPLPVGPIAAGVPLKSNTRTYGPWLSAGANPGSVNCDIDDSLVPWEYGSIDYMNAAGVAKVQNSVTSLQVGERGEVTIPGYPTASLGSMIEANPAQSLFGNRYLLSLANRWPQGNTSYRLVVGLGYTRYAGRTGVTRASVAASISNINVSVGTNGVTTSFTINTFTPVFGRFSKNNAERLKNVGLRKFKSERQARSQSMLKSLIHSAVSKSKKSITRDIGKGAIAPKSPSVWFAGKLTEDRNRKVVLAPTADTLTYYQDYDNTAMMTMDAFYRPVSTSGSVVIATSGLPKINMQEVVGESDGYIPAGHSQSTAPPPPINEYKPLPIRQKYLDFLGDPYENVGLFNDIRTQIEDGGTLKHASSVRGSGHDIEGVARESIAWLRANQPKNSNSMLTHLKGNPTGTYASDYRFLAHRGPLMLHGWGYDIHGKPIPNASGDHQGSGGIFATEYAGLSDRFKENWLSDARDWPVAPIDLRFDRKRGVWTIPPAFRMYQVECSFGVDAGQTGPFKVIKSKTDLCDSSGQLISDPTINVENWTSNDITAGDKNLAYYDTAESKYWLVGGGGGGVITAGISSGGTPAKWNQQYKTFQEGCIWVWPLSTPDEFDSNTIYPNGSRVMRSIHEFSTGTLYGGGDQVLYTGNGVSCPSLTYVTATGHPAGIPFGDGDWVWSGCATSKQYMNTGDVIGVGSFDVNSGWLFMSGTTYLNTQCVTTWKHGMRTTPVAGHYVEGGGGSNILVWYDCDIIPGWEGIHA